MKKVLMIFDGQHFSDGAFNFACRLRQTEPILLTGIFLPSIDYTSTLTYYLGLEAPVYYPMLDTEDEAIAENIEKFKTLCEKNNIAYQVHEKIRGAIVEGIRYETRYADLLILSSEIFYSNLGFDTQKEYLHNTAHNAECPVLMVPEDYEYPESLILAYDGTASSMFAIKQFVYLFPELTSLKTTLTHVSIKDNDVLDLDLMKEFVQSHFSCVSFLELNIDPKHYFTTWLQEAGPALLVAGAYGRSLVSEIFRRSFIHEVVKEHQIPVFIAHR